MLLAESSKRSTIPGIRSTNSGIRSTSAGIRSTNAGIKSTIPGITSTNELKWFYIPTSPNEDYLSAARTCSNLGTLASVSTRDEAQKILELIANTNSDIQGFWINAKTKDNFRKLGIMGVSGHTQDSCLLLLNNKVNNRFLTLINCLIIANTILALD